MSTAVQEIRTDHIVWLNEKDRIASFHHVEGYRVETFNLHDHFISFLHSLQERGFRFQ